MERQSIRLRLLFEDCSVLNETQRSDDMNQSWLLIEPQQHPKISDVCNHLLHIFNLHRSCPNGILLYMQGFVLPSSESTRILKDNEILRVKRKGMALAEAIEGNLLDYVEVIKKEPVNNDMLLLANGEFDKERYQSKSEEENVKDEPSTIETVSKKRKAFTTLGSSKSEHLQENEEGVAQASTAPDGAKKGPSRSAIRKKNKRRWQREHAKITRKMSQEHKENVVDLETNGDNKHERKDVKRTQTSERFVLWDHFNSFVNEKGENKYSCKYCGKRYFSRTEIHGTSTLLGHLKQCPLYLKNKGDDETRLAVQSGGLDEQKVIEWKFDQQLTAKALMQMIIMDELPFEFVEGNRFKHFMSVTQPLFQIPSRFIVARDCYQMFIDEKEKIRALLNENIGRICLTTNTWTSIQEINYMFLTAHFIDNDWNLRKKVINFCPISSHRGKDIGEAIEMCLFGWGIDNVFTITVDDTSASDLAVEYLKSKFENWGKCVLKAKWTHVRCFAHILNLIVQDGLGRIGTSVDCVRGAVKHILQSPARLGRFKQYAKIEKCESTKILVLDDPIGWTSTYLMLETAQLYERTFYRYDSKERLFRDDLGKTGVPTSLDWANVRKMTGFLKHFYDLTLKVSDTRYVTSHTFLDDITSTFVVLKKCLNEVDDIDLLDIAKLMKEKFDKYYGNIKKFNMLVYVASVLDPRNKLKYLEVLLLEVYGKVDGESILNIVKDAINELFEDYVRIHSTPNSHSTSESSKAPSLLKPSTSVEVDVKPEMFIKESFRMKMKMKIGSREVSDSKSELEKYLSEEIEDDYLQFDILNWWRVNNRRFPILSLVARDVLAVPISTVDSESGLSTNGRVLDSFRSSLTYEMVECLVCSQGWLRGSSISMDIEES